ncbi:MAG: cation:proton antiporter [Treponema sp.]|nr:cation:proton antiporter [Candidatus Treponema equifaecale]
MEAITLLVFQLAVIIFAVRIFGKLAAKVGIPSVLGELIAGIIIGPYALGTIGFFGFPEGLFPLNTATQAVSPELYAIAQVASIILLFTSGLETDLSLFLKYSVSGGIIGIGGVVISFLFGDICAMMIINVLPNIAPCTGFFDSRCLFLGIMSTATSVGITARILSDKKKMDSPEGVTILAAAVFDDVLGIVLLAVVMGIVAATNGGAALSGAAIGLIAVKAISIWLVATLVFVIFAKYIAKFVRLFGGTYDFSIAAFGVALILAGIFEKQGLAMIIGAYTTGLALSRTDIAPIIQERMHGLYKFFVPVFFAVTGMSVDVTQLFNKDVLICGGVYTLFCIASKIIGCGGPALALGFNFKGGFRIGAGMIPRGEVALIISGIGLAAGIIDQKLFGVVILMTLLTTLIAPPVLSLSLKLKGRGTRKEAKNSENQQFIWDFNDAEVGKLIVDMLLRDLRSEGFYVQMMNISEGICQARRSETSYSICLEGSQLKIETDAADMGFIKGEIYEEMIRLNKSLSSLNALKNTASLQYGFASPENRVTNSVTKYLTEACISTDLKGNTKNEIIEELAMLLIQSGNVTNRDKLLTEIKAREKVMSTGLGKGIAIPHAKTDGVSEVAVAVGIKKEGVDFESLDGQPAKIFIAIASPSSNSGPHMRVMSAFSGALMHEEVTKKLLQANTPKEIIEIFKDSKK